ncbi:hypothetical protein [Streptomyces marianii]|uniref:Uncharacterized protein n=1 Tax=Streptomyces marianii TaxID=1817406 RepID=A0A5R9DSI7_9ACTN|nr:hypothetical protein [Streptomyces marianii]TLQ38965.1 hypothetical protein FEF34_39800 [Streptomyces marianii]
MMDELRFDSEIGTIAVTARENSLSIEKAMGTHSLRLQLELKLPSTGAGGRAVILEADLYARFGAAQKAWLGTATRALAFTPGAIVRPHLQYLLTSAQLLALEDHRTGDDLQLALDVRAVLPQAAGYPGCSPATLNIDVAESRWRQQLEGLGRSLAFELSIPFPADNEPHQEAVGHLREAQRRLRDDDIDGSLLEARRALEYIKDHSGWSWPGKKPKEQRLQDERWAWIRAGLEDQTSGAVHADAVTRHFSYTRAEVETMIAMVTALLRLV